MFDSKSADRSKIIYHDFRDEESSSEFIGDAICVMGMFDGVHVGHRRLIDNCLESARSKGCTSVIITFDIDPLEFFEGSNPRKLMTNEDRIDMLSGLGADIVLVESFTKEFSQLSPEAFIENVMFSKMNPIELHIGSNFRFGTKAAGNIDTLHSEFDARGFSVMASDLFEVAGEVVSATRIRDLIEEGRIELANELLGRSFSVKAKVMKGRQEGRKLGFPTANLSPVIEYANIADAVYAGYVLVDGKWYKSATSVGVPKTFGDIDWTIEAHILDFDGDIYGQTVEASFVRFLRPMQSFGSLDELIAAITGNAAQARELPEL